MEIKESSGGCNLGCLGTIVVALMLIHVLQGGTIDAVAFIIFLIVLALQA